MYTPLRKRGKISKIILFTSEFAFDMCEESINKISFSPNTLKTSNGISWSLCS